MTAEIHNSAAVPDLRFARFGIPLINGHKITSKKSYLIKTYRIAKSERQLIAFGRFLSFEFRLTFQFRNPFKGLQNAPNDTVKMQDAQGKNR